MKLSEYVLRFLEQKEVDTLFYLPGGGCMHLLDSLACSRKIQGVSLLHEQAVAVAAAAYSDRSNKIGVALVTTGPGATNTVTGVVAAYQDSAPCFFISGQVKTPDLKANFHVRAHGSQEADIVEIVRSVTKYAVIITDKNSIRYHLERAWHEAISGRAGPVWIDIPLDIQGAQIEEKDLIGFTPELCQSKVDVSPIIALLNQSTRPLLIAGNGLRACIPEFHQLADYLSIPITPTWKAIDILPFENPLYAGHTGGLGTRYGNIAMQNADLLISFGSKLDFSITGFDRSAWAPHAKKLIIDIDGAEIDKLGVCLEASLVADVRLVVEALWVRREEITLPNLLPWKRKIQMWKQKYPVLVPEKYALPNGKLTSYGFVESLCRLAPGDICFVPCSSGTTAEIFCQACQVKAGQLVSCIHGLGSMGFELPGAIGASFAFPGKEVLVIAGDGGIQLNIQELATIQGNRLPVKLFVINNSGYASIRNMQRGHFEGRLYGCDSASGLFLPNWQKLSEAYGFTYDFCETLAEIDETIQAVLQKPGPALCEIRVEETCMVTPRSATMVLPDGSLRSSPLENQFPFLPIDEVAENGCME